MKTQKAFFKRIGNNIAFSVVNTTQITLNCMHDMTNVTVHTEYINNHGILHNVLQCDMVTTNIILYAHHRASIRTKIYLNTTKNLLYHTFKI